jgi:hypothetical protein
MLTVQSTRSLLSTAHHRDEWADLARESWR